MRALEKVERQKAIPLLIFLHFSHQSWYPQILQMFTDPTMNIYLSENSKAGKENSAKYMVSEFQKILLDLQRLIVFSALPSRIKGVCEIDICLQRKIILVVKLFLVHSALQKVLVYDQEGHKT